MMVKLNKLMVAELYSMVVMKGISMCRDGNKTHVRPSFCLFTPVPDPVMTNLFSLFFFFYIHIETTN